VASFERSPRYELGELSLVRAVEADGVPQSLVVGAVRDGDHSIFASMVYRKMMRKTRRGSVSELRSERLALRDSAAAKSSAYSEPLCGGSWALWDEFARLHIQEDGRVIDPLAEGYRHPRGSRMHCSLHWWRTTRDVSTVS